MANATGKVSTAQTPVTDEKSQALLVTTAQTYYNGAMLGWNISGLLDKYDDAASLRYAGILENAGPVVITSTSTEAERRVSVRKTRYISKTIAAAVVADVGRKVYALYDNEVAYTPGTYGNYVGTMAGLVGTSSTEIWIDTFASDQRKDGPALSLAATGAITLTKDQLNRTVLVNNTAAQTINLPAVAYTNAGDWLDFIKTTADAYAFTLDGNSSETINNATTLVSGVNRYERVRIVSTGSAWIAQQTVLDDVTMNSITGGDSSLDIVGQASSTTTGGSVNVTGGASSFATGVGGAVVITGGGGGANAVGGAATIIGGTPSSGNAAGAVASITGGAGLGSGNGGIGKVVGGAAGATGTGGKGQLIGGAGVAGAGGDAEVTGGAGGGATNNGGAVTITAGASGGASGTAGSVTISSGAANSGTVGAVNIQTAAAGKIGFFNTAAVAQPSGNGTQATSAAGATGTVFLNTTLTGGLGSTAYTPGDIVRCLKLLGLITT